MQDLYTVDELASILNLHPRTIRRYIRDGQLKAAKVGGEWRIHRDDAETFVGGHIRHIKQAAFDEVNAFLHPTVAPKDASQGKLQVCAIVNYSPDSPDDSMRMAEVFLRFMNQPDAARGQAKFEYFTDPDVPLSRYILWGSPAFVARVLAALEESASTNPETQGR